MKKTWEWNELVFATHNLHKVEELAAIFQESLGVNVVGLHSYPTLDEIVEDRDTFEGNACKKAEEIARQLNRPVAADDSGLSVRSLSGAPGVYSKRYAGEQATDKENNEKLLAALSDKRETERKAAFVCVLALAVPGEKTQVVRGELPGIIAHAPRGDHGFGYDPLFYLSDLRCTLAELTPVEKNRLSHRAVAAKQLLSVLQAAYSFPANN